MAHLLLVKGLDLPVGTQIHPVFHVSQLKLAVGDHSVLQKLPVTIEETIDLQVEPEELLVVRIRELPDGNQQEVLIK